MNWIMLNLQSEADLMQKEMDKFNKAKGTSVVRASTNDDDFEEMIRRQREKLLNNR